MVVINASDLAAAGANPIGFLAALDLDREMPVEELQRLLSGIRDACSNEGLRYAGGNIREAKQTAAVGTAIGTTGSSTALRRVGAVDGDRLVIIGRGGRFWTDAIAVQRGGTVDPKHSPLYRPSSQITAMSQLREAGLITAAIDNSDGLLPSVQLLGSANHLGVVLDLDALSRHGETMQAAASLGVNPGARLWLGWGDWNVVTAVHPQNVSQVIELCYKSGSEALSCGFFDGSLKGTFVSSGGRVASVPRLESERFATDSWFSAGIETYIQSLLCCDLPV